MKGVGKVPIKDSRQLQLQLFEAMGCSSWAQYYRRRKGYFNIPFHTKIEIEKIFAKFGITNPEDIWEMTETDDQSDCKTQRKRKPNS